MKGTPMKKTNILLMLMVVLLVAVPVFAAETMSPSSSSSTTSTSSFKAFHASDMIGKTVKNKDGEELGKVEDLVISRDGRIDFVVLSYGGTLGIGEKFIPVPYQTFMSNEHNMANLNSDNDLIANLDKAQLDKAPSFSDRNWDVSSKSMQDKICSYYGAGACPSHG
jgi:sporulation protein YlmC with PRC-barrel domain